MDLKQLYKETIQALDKERETLAQEKQRILDKEADLNTREMQIAESYKQLEADIRTVSDVKDVKALKEENEQRLKDIVAREQEMKKRELELKKYENQLYEIKTRQDETDKRLAEREVEVSHRERTYREEIEKSFASNLAKNLLNK